MLALGTIIPSLSGILWRLANLSTTNLSVNSDQYLRPGLSLSWPFLSALADVRHPVLLITGACVIIAANPALAHTPFPRPDPQVTPNATRP